PQDIYQAVLPLILNYLQQPINIETLAKQLEVKQGQLKDWLERAVKEGKVKKNNKPVRYVANQSNSQLSLLSES
ncbi:MAG: DNA-processing protein DprA, partial [Microcoleaceae cyanobacterium]